MKKREKKQEIINELKSLFSNYENIFFINLKNLKVNQLNKFKRELRNINSKLRVAKKTLIAIANNQIKSILQNSIFNTPLGLIFSNRNTDLELINLLDKYRNEIKLEVIGVYLNNNFYEANRILSLSRFKNRNHIYINLISLFKNKLSGLVINLKYPIIKLNMVVNNIKK